MVDCATVAVACDRGSLLLRERHGYIFIVAMWSADDAFLYIAELVQAVSRLVS